MKNSLDHTVYISMAITLMFLFCRVIYSGSPVFLFMTWNLFLAWIPFGVSKILFNGYNKRAFKIYLAFIIWLLFLPNAPYLITDLFHLKERPPVPFYFDLVLLYLFSWNGMILCFLSLRNTEKWWIYNFRTVHVFWFRMIVFFLCGFGVYLGRYKRWNSWDVFNQPGNLSKDILERIFKPWEHPGTWAASVLFTIILMLLYEIIKKIPVGYNNNKQVF